VTTDRPEFHPRAAVAQVHEGVEVVVSFDAQR
jgi:hypothetical protein